MPLLKSGVRVFFNVMRVLVRIGCKRTEVRATIADLKLLTPGKGYCLKIC